MEIGRKAVDNGSLKILIKKGVKPRRGIPGLVLSHFAEFTEARALGWSWSDIAEAMGRPGEEKGFSTAFCKIKKRIGDGKLKLRSSGAVPVSKEIPSPSKATGTSPPKKTFPKVGEKQKEETDKGDFDFQSLPQI